MENQSEKIQAFLLQHILEHPNDIVDFTANHFSVSRTTVHRHLYKLIRDQKIVKTGDTKGSSYHLKSALNKQFALKINRRLEEFEIWREHFRSAFKKLSKNVFNICEYGFTEIFNNVIDHSEGQHVWVSTNWSGQFVEITIKDDGVGIFKKIRDKFHFEDIRESVVALSKGKLTTDPAHHSGEGIFFTSRAFDVFSIFSNGIFYVKNNREKDWFFEKRSGIEQRGSSVVMSIRIDSLRDLIAIFKKFQNEDSLSFDRTELLVKLAQFQEDQYISRSQAKRLLFGAEKFKHIILDFEGVSMVGQAFVDEVFRVFQAKYPDINIEYRNANDDVVFMIERGIQTMGL